MTLGKDKKSEIIKNFGKHDKDAGSTKIQIAILTERIRELASHFDEHPKDNHSRRGLVMMVAKRRKLLKYLVKTDYNSYKKLIKELGIRK